MARLTVCVLALLVAGAFAYPDKISVKNADPVLLQRQSDLMILFSHPHEPNHEESCKTIYNTWTLEKNIEHFSNVTAVKTLIEMLEHDWVLPKGYPLDVHETEHRFEVITLFNVLFSAKDYDTFYKAAVYLREHVNEHLFTYVLSVVILNRKDTQGIVVPQIYEVFPSFFNNGEVMTTAQRINTHGYHYIDHYPSTYKWDDNVVIRKNATIWNYHYNTDSALSYFTHDYQYNAFYYNLHISHPSWLSGEVAPWIKERRGEWFWFVHKNFLTRYYMERLSNGLGEIPEIGHEVVTTGYVPGLLYHNGVPFPVRPNYFHLDQPNFVEEVQNIYDYERRVRDAIDHGYIVNNVGDHINLRVPEAIDILGHVIQANVDSPNAHYYKDFISVWKKVLGNSYVHEHPYYHHNIPLVVPSVLEHYQTALRDPAFYIIWKRVFGLFQQWQKTLPHYKKEELALPQVAIQKVDIDKLVTFFEYSYMNVTNHLHTTVDETTKTPYDKQSVLVQHVRLNHKDFQVRIKVKSEVAKSVMVRFFLAPKYDGHGAEIPLHVNSNNFFSLDEFVFDLPAGESVITRNSGDNNNAIKKWFSSFEMYEDVQEALHGKKQFVVETSDELPKMPQRLVLPKGRVGGMPFVLMVYINEYRAPAQVNSPYRSDEPLGFPVNRPLYPWIVEDLTNMVFQDVLIYHKPTTEISLVHHE